MTTFLYWFPT